MTATGRLSNGCFVVSANNSGLDETSSHESEERDSYNPEEELEVRSLRHGFRPYEGQPFVPGTVCGLERSRMSFSMCFASAEGRGNRFPDCLSSAQPGLGADYQEVSQRHSLVYQGSFGLCSS